MPALAACLTRGTGLRYDTDTDTILPVTHSLRGEGFDASEDGTGRGTPLVPMYTPDVSATLVGRSSRGGGQTNSPGHNADQQLVAHAFDARQSDVIQYGDKTGPLDTDGHSVAVAVRTANTSANGHGISAELAHTLDQAQGQAVAIGFDSYNQMLTGDITQTIGTSLELNPKVLAPTLTATNAPSRSPQSSEITSQVAAVTAAAMQVRRLTPTECERLQGFPDNYTAIPWRGKPASECPDGPRYKALGNSWAVPCVRWIGRRIAAQIA